jgi:hypothetical protein
VGDRSVFDPADLPTTAQLVRASIAALIVAVLVVLTAVLPAELGVDPTGVGEALGLTNLSAATGNSGVTQVGAGESRERSDERKITLQPGQSIEVKVVMRADDSFSFYWSTNSGPLYFDFHGDPEGRPASEFVSYERGSKQSDEGTLKAEFGGKHGWYWKNKNSEAVTVTLETRGVYQSVTK